MARADRKPLSTKQARHFNLHDHGVVFFEQAIAPADIALLKDASDHDYDLITRQLQPGNSRNVGEQVNHELAALVAQSSARWGGIPVNHYLALAAAEKPTLSSVFAAVDEKIRDLLRSACGQPARYKSEVSFIRRHRSTATHLPWHFDCYAAGTINFDPAYNVWIPFVPVGVECPSLEFVVGSHRTMRAGDYRIGPEPKLVDTGSGYAILPGDAGSEKPGWPAAEWVEHYLSDDNHICVALCPGDIVIFDHFTLHRTQWLPAGGVIRTSAELRFTTRPDA